MSDPDGSTLTAPASPPVRALTRDDVRRILEDHANYEWQVQGFGMLRIYLPGEMESRLQVWDQRLASWSNNAIHDHPWAFRSTVYAGQLINQRYQIQLAHPHGPYTATTGNGHITEIVPGTRGGLLSERPVLPCQISRNTPEVYAMGDSYRQTHREMHLTKYAQGTVTVIDRFEREEADIARVAWFGEPHDQPPFVQPYPADRKTVALVIGDCLRAWWLPRPWWEKPGPVTTPTQEPTP